MKKINAIFAIVINMFGGLLGCMGSNPAESEPVAVKPAAMVTATPLATLIDQPIAPYRAELLDLAFSTASAIPVNPLIKDRSRMQDLVISTCIELDQPARAKKFLADVQDWRAGSGYAELARYCASHDLPEDAQQMLIQALPVMQQADDWRRDRIRNLMAETYMMLGQTTRALELQQTLAPAEQGKNLLDSEGTTTASQDLDAQIAFAGKLLQTGTFETTYNTLISLSKLHREHYADVQRRAQLEQMIQEARVRIPHNMQIELIAGLARNATQAGNTSAALAMVDTMQAQAEAIDWLPENRAESFSRLIRMRHLAGDRERARSEADQLRAYYMTERENIVSIFRGESLRPLIETYHAFGDTSTTLALARQALDESVINPNSRPRAEDLTQLCVTLARAGIEPDSLLWARIREIRNGLGQPW